LLISKRDGHGFIACKAVGDQFPVYDSDGKRTGGRDVYIESGLLPQGARRGSRLLFTITTSAKFHPKAVTCRLASAI